MLMPWFEEVSLSAQISDEQSPSYVCHTDLPHHMNNNEMHYVFKQKTLFCTPFS